MDSNAIASIITATISGVLVAIPTIFATISANKASSAVMDERMKNMGDQIKNMSDKVWKVKMPDGSIHEVGSGKGFPLWAGVSADIGGVNIEL